MSIPIPRELDVDLSSVPARWMAGSVAATAIANGVNMLFPHGERLFVRSVHQYYDQIDNDDLRAAVKAFFKQEGHHATAHDDLNDVIRAQGYEIDRFLAIFTKVTSWIEARVPAKLNLAGTAAAEHFTAIMAHGAFTRGMLDQCDPAMKKLLAWHAAEEIEHKAVAFDVLQQVDSSYALRLAGLAYATLTLSAFWAWGTAMLLRQEKLGLRGLRRDLRELRQRGRRDQMLKRVFGAGIRQYIRRDFHPRHVADEHLAAAWFAAHGLPFASHTTEAA